MRAGACGNRILPLVSGIGIDFRGTSMRRILMTALALGGTMVMGSAARADFGSDTSWWKSFAISGYADAGIMGNPTGSTAGTNFGRLFDDRPNKPELNQLSVLV